MLLAEAARGEKFALFVRKALAENGQRAHLPGFVSEQSSREMFAALQQLDWRVVANIGHLRPAMSDRVASAQDIATVYAEARDNFRYMYDGYLLSEEFLAGRLVQGPLAEFFRAINAPATIQLFRDMTGANDIVYLDAFASRYRSGQFLLRHNDSEKGGERRFAYVFNFTPEWRADWGGLLAFVEDNGNLSDGYAPRFGALNIFKVPQMHTVTVVAPYAGADRYSITGWMRARRPESAFLPAGIA